MTETTERFLQEIAARVGYDRVAELYLFPVLRQGGVEGAVAVVAAYPEPVVDASDASAEGAAAAAAAHEPASVDEGNERVLDVESDEGAADESDVPIPDLDVTDSLTAEGLADVGSDTLDDADDTSADESVAASAKSSTVDASESESPASRPDRARHVVYTARYRHTIKGTDRGRWMVEVVAEADAPLITVEEVVRGVVRRSGDAFQPERISGDQFRAIVPAPAAPGSAPA